MTQQKLLRALLLQLVNGMFTRNTDLNLFHLYRAVYTGGGYKKIIQLSWLAATPVL